MSSCPAQRQSTQTFAGVSTREANLLDGIAGLLNVINRPAVFAEMAEMRQEQDFQGGG
jgi:hypothetical protein